MTSVLGGKNGTVSGLGLRDEGEAGGAGDGGAGEGVRASGLTMGTWPTDLRRHLVRSKLSVLCLRPWRVEGRLKLATGNGGPAAMAGRAKRETGGERLSEAARAGGERGMPVGYPDNEPV